MISEDVQVERFRFEAEEGTQLSRPENCDIALQSEHFGVEISMQTEGNSRDIPAHSREISVSTTGTEENTHIELGKKEEVKQSKAKPDSGKDPKEIFFTMVLRHNDIK